MYSIFFLFGKNYKFIICLCIVSNLLIIISDHLLPDPLYCKNDCGRYYTGKKRKSSLKRHLTYECGIDPQFRCIYCQKRFTVKTNMKRHVLLIHKVLKYV